MKTPQASIHKIIKTLIWPKRRRIGVGLLLIIISKISALVLPGAFKFLIDDVLIAKNIEILPKIILAVIAAIILQAITAFLLTKVLSIEAHRLIANLRVKVQKQIISLPLSFFERNKSGEIAKRVMDDIDGLKNIMGTGLVLFLGGFITSLASLSILLYISETLTLYTVIPIILMGIISLKTYKFLRPLFRKRKKIEATVLGRLTESIAGVRIIKGYNAQNFEREVFKKGVEKIYHFYNKTLTAQALILSLAIVILGIASVLVMWIGSRMIINEELAIGEFISFILYLGFMVSPIIQMTNIGSLLTEAIAGLDRTEELMSLETEEDNLNRKISLNDINGELIFQDVSFTYNNKNQVLKNINLTIKPGTSLALVGHSGAGKSTLASLIAAFIEPTKGTIKIDGFNLSHIKHQTYRKHLGMVLQDDFLFDGTIKENILFSKPEASDHELKQAVTAAFVFEFTKRFENGLDTIIGERGIKLSGGQKQRISIARAILSNPKILILDEATSSLDVKSEKYIQKAITDLLKNRTSIIIAHRLSTIQSVDCILVLDNGKIIEKGNHYTLMKKKGEYYNMVQLQSRI
jgi:subfamily B ATP-binding cassette protein MsbA